MATLRMAKNNKIGYYRKYIYIKMLSKDIIMKFEIYMALAQRNKRAVMI
jgi:hypothetical protein